MSFAEKFKIKLKILCRRSLGEEKSFAEASSAIRWHFVETSSTNSSPCVDGPLAKRKGFWSPLTNVEINYPLGNLVSRNGSSFFLIFFSFCFFAPSHKSRQSLGKKGLLLHLFRRNSSVDCHGVKEKNAKTVLNFCVEKLQGNRWLFWIPLGYREEEGEEWSLMPKRLTYNSKELFEVKHKSLISSALQVLLLYSSWTNQRNILPFISATAPSKCRFQVSISCRLKLRRREIDLLTDSTQVLPQIHSKKQQSRQKKVKIFFSLSQKLFIDCEKNCHKRRENIIIWIES